MPEVVIKVGDSAEQEAQKEANRRRMADIKALFAAGDIEGGAKAMAAYQAERAEFYRAKEREAAR